MNKFITNEIKTAIATGLTTLAKKCKKYLSKLLAFSLKHKKAVKRLHRISLIALLISSLCLNDSVLLFFVFSFLGVLRVYNFFKTFNVADSSEKSATLDTTDTTNEE
jgi:hypothetical protein